MKTEVLSTSVFLEISIGNLDGAVAVSLLMVATAGVVLALMRFVGSRDPLARGTP
jgi:molybdate transport system permease protein